MNSVALIFFIVALSLLLIGRLRSYFRTGLKGELILIIGGIVIIIGGIIDNNWLMMGGFVIGNIGLIILATVESAKRKEIFRNTNLLDRLIGNVPIIKEKQFGPPVVRKDIGIATGVICLVLAFIRYEKLTEYNLHEITVIGLLALSGIFFIIFSIFRGTRQH